MDQTERWAKPILPNWGQKSQNYPQSIYHQLLVVENWLTLQNDHTRHMYFFFFFFEPYKIKFQRFQYQEISISVYNNIYTSRSKGNGLK